VLFFAKNVRHFFNQAYISCLLGKGTGKVDVLDCKDFDGGIVADIEDAMRFVARNTRAAWKIEALQRHAQDWDAMRQAFESTGGVKERTSSQPL